MLGSRWHLMRLAAALLTLTLCLLAVGCDTARSTIQLQSAAARQNVLAPKWVEVIARITDINTIDIYMLDQPLEDALRFDPQAAEGAGPKSLQVCHIHIFLTPRAGRTPIQATACTATVHHLIMAQGEAGEYGGAGFVTPRISNQQRHVRASIVDGRARMIRATAGFADKLYDADVNGAMSARHDPAKARQVERALVRWRLQLFGDSAE